MTNYKEILRILSQGISQRNVSLACQVSRNTVASVVRRCHIHNLSWEEAQCMSNETIWQRLFPESERTRDTTFRMPDYPQIHKELAKPHVTLQLLWEEYCQICKKNQDRYYQYTQFCKYYHDFAVNEKITIRIEHKPGELLEVDWVGFQPTYFDPGVREYVKTSMFVAVLPYSQLVYAEIFEDQTLENWIEAHVHTFSYMSGVTRIIRPDNLRTGVTKADWFSPIIQKTYQEMAEYYGTVVLPARPKRPRDKSSAEGSVRIVERRILAALRNQRFLSFEELHKACLAELENLNSRIMKQKKESRWTIFLAEEKEHLLPLHTRPFEVSTWNTAKVQINSHISFQKHFYSVPFEYTQKEVDIRSTKRMVEVFYHQERIASHQRLWGKQLYATNKDHMPRDKQFYQDWDADRFRHWARKYGPSTVLVIESILHSFALVQQTYNSCLGLMALAKKYSAVRLEKACKLALSRTSVPRYRLVKDILSKDEDLEQPVVGQSNNNSTKDSRPKGHQRGSHYYKDIQKDNRKNQGGTDEC